MIINLLLTALLMLPRCSYSLDAITSGHPIRDGDVLLSARRSFALGFFSPRNSRNRYVGIWYHMVPEQTVVWVANRDDPIGDKSGVLAVDGRGGLVIYAGERKALVWSANVSVASGNGTVARLLDVGNLVLFGQKSESVVLWQSFDHPTDTMLPFMRLGVNRKSGFDLFLTSWKSASDPGTGNCSYRINSTGYPQLFLYQGMTDLLKKDKFENSESFANGGAPRWRGGPWTGRRWSGVPQMARNFIFNTSYVDNQDEVMITYGILNQTIFSRMAVDESGTVYRSTWRDQGGGGRWFQFWSAPTEFCDNYGQCGANGYCDPAATNDFMCKCLPGFEPKSTRDWFLRDGSGGCERRKGVGTCGDGEGFVKLTRAKVPDTSEARVDMDLNLEACDQECRRNCSCTAFATANESAGGIGCLMWYGDLVDTRTYSSAGQDLYVRVDAITLREFTKDSHGFISKINKKLSIALMSSVAVLLLLLFFACWWAKKKRKEKEQRICTASVTTTSGYSGNLFGKKELGERRASTELPFFNLNTITAATDNFSIDNKLGEGGFGPVYKGMLCDGKEIAVKRLSKHSGQGVEEFKNEVTLIAKLQHRNLVGTLGYCVQGEEKMLIYEYLPNKSLDSFIFDEAKRKLLDWRKRFDIIFGVARGLLYLHQDSRLRIIHRDLKASNILLDDDMNPKISDFGMARIFGGNQIEANTNRVVGTYGYMSPEYAMSGCFSTKSDVYSFGVLLLEIVTGQKNTSYFNEDDPDMNLVGHVWELWTQGKALELVDSSVNESFGGEALKCVKIGLLCVQDYANDRPNMSTVVFMLANDAEVPTPKQPAFVFKKRSYTSGDPSISEEAISINDVTCSIVEAR